jgi:hypothetical protein
MWSFRSRGHQHIAAARSRGELALVNDLLGTRCPLNSISLRCNSYRLGGWRYEETQQMNATSRALPHARVHAIVLGLPARKVWGNNGGAVFGGNDQRR